MESREKQKMKIKKHAVSSMTGAYMESYEIISKNPGTSAQLMCLFYVHTIEFFLLKSLQNFTIMFKNIQNIKSDVDKQ